MNNTFAQLTRVELNNVVGGSHICQRNPPEVFLTERRSESMGSANLLYSGAAYVMIGAVAVAAAPFVATGAAALAISGAVLSAGGSTLVAASLSRD